MKDGLVSEIADQLNQYDRVTFTTMGVTFFCHYRMDLDNCIMGVKFSVDAFREWGGIQDDSTKYLKWVKIKYDNTLPKGTGKIIFTDLGK